MHRSTQNTCLRPCRLREGAQRTRVTLKQAAQRRAQRATRVTRAPSGATSFMPICRHTFCMA